MSKSRTPLIRLHAVADELSCDVVRVLGHCIKLKLTVFYDGSGDWDFSAINESCVAVPLETLLVAQSARTVKIENEESFISDLLISLSDVDQVKSSFLKVGKSEKTSAIRASHKRRFSNLEAINNVIRSDKSKFLDHGGRPIAVEIWKTLEQAPVRFGISFGDLYGRSTIFSLIKSNPRSLMRPKRSD